MFRQIREDIRVIFERDPAAKNVFEVLLTYQGLHAIMIHRLAHWFYKIKLFTIARIFSSIGRLLTGIEIHPGAKIGKRPFIDHGNGVVIGETVEIGDDVVIYQGVTLGGTGKEMGKRHPTIGNNVMVSCGAKVLGPFKVGDNSKIGAGSVVLKEVPPNCTVIGVPGRIAFRNDKRIEKNSNTVDLEQVKLPDPIAKELECLRKKMIQIERQIHKMEEER